MAAKTIFKLDLSLTVRVFAHCFGVTSPCLCDTFPKFGDLSSHREIDTVERAPPCATEVNGMTGVKCPVNAGKYWSNIQFLFLIIPGHVMIQLLNMHRRY